MNTLFIPRGEWEKVVNVDTSTCMPQGVIICRVTKMGGHHFSLFEQGGKDTSSSSIDGHVIKVWGWFLWCSVCIPAFESRVHEFYVQWVL